MSREQQRSGAALMAAASLAAIGLSASAGAAVAPDRAEYVSRLESICKPGVEATQRAVRGVRSDIRGRTPRRRGGKARQGRADLRRDRGQDLGRSAPAARRDPARQVVRLPPAPGVLSGPGPPRLCARSASSRYQHNAVRFVHNGNLANDVVIAFGFNYCRFKFSRFN